MAQDPLENLRLSLMQDLLPVGIAMFERARRGGASKVAEVFTSSSDPLKELRLEGESAASSLREQLDKVSPGLGNPIVSVEVDVDEKTDDDEMVDKEILLKFLSSVEARFDALENELADLSDRTSSSTVDS